MIGKSKPLLNWIVPSMWHPKAMSLRCMANQQTRVKGSGTAQQQSCVVALGSTRVGRGAEDQAHPLMLCIRHVDRCPGTISSLTLAAAAGDTSMVASARARHVVAVATLFITAADDNGRGSHDMAALLRVYVDVKDVL